MTIIKAYEDVQNWEQDADELSAWTFPRMKKELDDIFGIDTPDETVQNYLDAAHNFGAELKARGEE